MHIPAGLPDWTNETVAILGGGPSLTREQAEYCRGKCKTIGINRAYRDDMAPWIDWLHAYDEEFWLNHPAAVKWPGLKTTGQSPSGIVGGDDIILIKMAPKYTAKPFDDPMRPVHAGRDSGYQAIQLAALVGAARVLLLGFDAHSVGRHGKHNWHEGYEYLGQRKPCDFEMHLGLHEDLEVIMRVRGVWVINCTPGSAITAYSMMPLEQALRARAA